MSSGFGTGLLLALAAVLLWGAQFPVAKLAYDGIDVFHLNTIRYSISLAMVLAVLVWREGVAALRYDGRLWDAGRTGLIGMCASPLLVFGGLVLTRPEVAAIIIATQPLLAAVFDWLVRGRRPSRVTIGCIVASFIGVVTVVTRWSVTLAPSGRELLGDLIVFAGAVCWVIYTMGVERFPGWSSLRYTTLTMLAGTAGTWLLLLVVLAAGWIAPPAPGDWLSVTPELAYLTLGGVLAAMLLWNAGTRRIGALNAVLLLNLVPVVAFAIGYLQGYRFAWIELAGALLVIAALVTNNLHLRRLRRQA